MLYSIPLRYHVTGRNTVIFNIKIHIMWKAVVLILHGQSPPYMIWVLVKVVGD